jgi:hypothetical protein
MIYNFNIKYNDETDKFQVLGYLDQEYSSFQSFVLKFLETYPSIFPIHDPKFSSYPVFYEEHWDTVEELIVKWFDWIDKHYAWHHELPLDLKKYCEPYQKQHFFRDALNYAYTLEQAYNTHLRGSVVF